MLISLGIMSGEIVVEQRVHSRALNEGEATPHVQSCRELLFSAQSLGLMPAEKNKHPNSIIPVQARRKGGGELGGHAPHGENFEVVESR